MPEFSAQYRQGLNRDDFGTVWRVEWTGVCGIPVEWPIANLERYAEYRWPPDFAAGPPTGRHYSGHMAGFDDRWYARGGWITTFEQLQQLRGMENALMDVALESPVFLRLLDDLLASGGVAFHLVHNYLLAGALSFLKIIIHRRTNDQNRSNNSRDYSL